MPGLVDRTAGPGHGRPGAPGTPHPRSRIIQALALPELEALPRPQLVALDIDGTILDGTGTLRDAVRAAIASVSASGVSVVLATGRSPWHGIAGIAASLGLPGPHIMMQGAVVADPATGQVERLRALPPEVYHEALRFARRSGLEPVVATLDGHRATEVPDGVDFLAAPLLGPRSFQHARDLDRLIDDGPVRIFLPTSPEAHPELLLAAERWFGDEASIVWSDRWGVEVLAAGTHKGEAVTWLAETRGVDIAAVAAVGDAANDTEMLHVAGRSAAMAAAPAHVRMAADIVVPTSDEDGILEAFAWFFPDLAGDFAAITGGAAA